MDIQFLNAVLDELIPPGDGMPGAGEIGLAADIERALQHHLTLAPVITQGLAALRTIAREARVENFATAHAQTRLALMKELESKEPALIPTLTFLAYSLYYQHPRVLEALGREARPPHPQGYEMGADDLTLLDPVRQRGKRFRNV
jgi:hypothetical protein